MNIKDISPKNEIIEKESSSDEQLEASSTKYYIEKLSKILLEREESPEIIIEKILINIFNTYISPKNYDIKYSDIDSSQKKIKKLCLIYENYEIIYYLLITIRNLIKKYREKIFELPNNIELQEKILQRYYTRSFSYIKQYSNNYINFWVDRPPIYNRSYPKRKKVFNYYITVKNLFCELKNIKNCLEKSAPVIEKIFEIPLAEFEKFSIYECEKEDYLRILIHDNFIWNEIIKNSKTQLYYIIEEIIEDENMNLTEMTSKLEYFKKIKEFNEKYKISKMGSSIDRRFPEDAKPISKIKSEIREYYNNFITEINNINYFPSKEEIDNDEYSNSNIEEEKLQNIEVINNTIDTEIDTDITTINKIKQNIISHATKPIDIKNQIIKIKSGMINIQKDNNYFDIPNLINYNNNYNINNKEKENIIKSLPQYDKMPNIHTEMNSIKNINNINFGKRRLLKNKEKILKNKEKLIKSKKDIKKDIKNEKSDEKGIKYKKIEKKEIPSNIDDWVKYIANDEKPETKNNKKKKKNRKKNKKNKNEIKNENIDKVLSQENEREKEKEENDEIKEIKNNFIQNSINRFKIHKIKFKYEPKWLETISNNK